MSTARGATDVPRQEGDDNDLLVLRRAVAALSTGLERALAAIAKLEDRLEAKEVDCTSCLHHSLLKDPVEVMPPDEIVRRAPTKTRLLESLSKTRITGNSVASEKMVASTMNVSRSLTTDALRAESVDAKSVEHRQRLCRERGRKW